MVRHKLKADQVDENKRLVKAIFSELSTKQPKGCAMRALVSLIADFCSYRFYRNN